MFKNFLVWKRLIFWDLRNILLALHQKNHSKHVKNLSWWQRARVTVKGYTHWTLKLFEKMVFCRKTFPNKEIFNKGEEIITCCDHCFVFLFKSKFLSFWIFWRRIKMKKSKNWDFWKIFFTNKLLHQKLNQHVSENQSWYNTHQTFEKECWFENIKRNAYWIPNFSRKFEKLISRKLRINYQINWFCRGYWAAKNEWCLHLKYNNQQYKNLKIKTRICRVVIETMYPNFIACFHFDTVCIIIFNYFLIISHKIRKINDFRNKIEKSPETQKRLKILKIIEMKME